MGKLSRVEKDFATFVKIVAESLSVAEVARKLGYAESGGVYQFLYRKFEIHKIDTSHFKGQAWNKGLTREDSPSLEQMAKHMDRDWDEIFCVGSSAKNSTLIRRLVNSGLRKYQCDECFISNWNGKPLRLHLEHKNGDNTDNREMNLKFLCPNCHSQTETFSRGLRIKRDGYDTRWWQRMSCH